MKKKEIRKKDETGRQRDRLTNGSKKGTKSLNAMYTIHIRSTYGMCVCVCVVSKLVL